MNTKKRYKQIFVNNEPVIDFSEQTVTSQDVLTGSTFFDRTGNIITGEYDLSSYFDRTVTEFRIPEGVTTLGTDAFSGCENLTKLYIPSSLDYIASGAFEGCYYLSEVHVDNIDTWLNMRFDEYGYSCNPIKDCGATLYVQGQPVTELVIPEGTTHIEDYAFYGWYNLEKVILPDSLEYIGDYAFGSCYNLYEINIPASVNYVGYGAFESCSATINCWADEQPEEWNSDWNPSGCTVIWGYRGTRTVDKIIYALQSPNKATVIDADGDITEAIIKDEVEGYAVQTIGSYAFQSKSELTKVTMPDSITSIEDGAFSWCEKLLEIQLSNNLSNIGADAFYFTTTLTSITIPNSVTTIGTDAFNKSLKAVYYNGTLEQWCNINFENVTSNPVYSGNADLFISGQKLEQVSITTSLTNNYTFSGCGSLKMVSININTIPDKTFANCLNLASLSLGNSVTSIGTEAFANCKSLTTITIPENVTSIKTKAFADCKQVSLINFNAKSLPNLSSTSYIFNNIGQNTGKGTNIIIGNKVSTIPAYLFTGSASTSSIGLGGLSKYNKISFEENSICSKIGANAFLGTTIKEVDLPASISAIDSSAFANCYKLRTIVIRSNITGGSSAFTNCTNLIEAYNLSGSSITYLKNLKYTYTSSTTPSIFKTVDDFIFATINGTNYLVDYHGNTPNLVLPDSYNGNTYKIFPYAFAWDCQLETVECSNGVTAIGDYAFVGTPVTDIIIGNCVTNIGVFALYCTQIKTYNIPASVTNLDTSAVTTGWATAINVDPANTKYTSINGILYNKEVTKLLVYLYETPGTTYVMPDTVETLGTNALSSRYLENIILSKNLKSIGSNGLDLFSSKATTLVIPDSVTTISDTAFRNWQALADITIGQGVSTIGSNIFYSSSWGTARKTIRVKGTTPCTIKADSFGSTSYVTSIFVPSGLVDTYKNATNWSVYAAKIKEAIV